MKKLYIIALLGLLIPSISQATLYDYYSGIGKNLPSITERSVVYSEVSDDTYLGTAEQNNALESYLRGSEVLGATTKIKLTDPNSVTPYATSTPTAGKIPMADGSGKLDGGWASNTAEGLVSLDSDTKLPAVDASQLTSIFREIVASDDLLLSNDAEVQDPSATYVLKKTFRINFGGTYRVKFDLRGNSNGQGFGRIYRNGVAFGTEQSQGGDTNSAADYVTKSEDLVFSAGDSIQVYIKGDGGGSPSTSHVRNFRLYGTPTSTLTYGYTF